MSDALLWFIEDMTWKERLFLFPREDECDRPWQLGGSSNLRSNSGGVCEDFVVVAVVHL